MEQTVFRIAQTKTLRARAQWKMPFGDKAGPLRGLRLRVLGEVRDA